MRRIWLFAACLLAPAAACAQAPDFSKVQLKATKVAGTVYVIEDVTPEFSGGNIGVSVGADGVVLVDDKFSPLAPKVEAAVKSISDKPVRFVLNTHYHGDHTDGNKAFAAKATIIAHENSRKRIMARTEEPTPASALPIVTFEQGLTIHMNGEDIRALHLPPGHTDTDVVVFFTQSNVAHLGDHFFNGMFPYIDVDGGGGVKGMIANIEKLLVDLPDDASLIPGHGPVGGKGELRAFLEMLKGTSEIVDKGIKAGKSARKLKSEKALSRYTSWGNGYFTQDQFIDMLYKDLSR